MYNGKIQMKKKNSNPWWMIVIDVIAIAGLLFCGFKVLTYNWLHIDQTSMRNWINMWPYNVALYPCIIWVSMRTAMWLKQ